MTGKRLYRLEWGLALLLSGCRFSPAVEEPVPERVPYEDSVYCFNQRSIVTLAGRKGMVGASGETILAPEWDDIEFLDDDIALLRRDDLFYLCTRNGRFFAESSDAALLEQSFRQRLADILDADMRSWDRVLDQLEALCEACLSCENRHPNARVIRENTRMQDCLQSVSGEMTPEQKERLAQIEKKFATLYQ